MYQCVCSDMSSLVEEAGGPLSRGYHTVCFGGGCHTVWRRREAGDRTVPMLRNRQAASNKVTP